MDGERPESLRARCYKRADRAGSGIYNYESKDTEDKINKNLHQENSQHPLHEETWEVK